VASSIQAVMAQRLIRVLCPKCRQPDDKPDPKFLNLCGITVQDRQTHTMYKAAGCANCGGSGYRGRKAIFEMMVMNSTLRDMAFKREAVAKIRVAALASGMRPLLGDGRLKILNGTTTPAEIARVAQVAGIVEE